jgi:hypothetical protein
MDVALGIFPLFARGKNPAPEDLLRFSYKGYSQGYQFEKTSAESGFENTITRIFYYQNLQLNACIEN